MSVDCGLPNQHSPLPLRAKIPPHPEPPQPDHPTAAGDHRPSLLLVSGDVLVLQQFLDLPWLLGVGRPEPFSRPPASNHETTLGKFEIEQVFGMVSQDFCLFSKTNGFDLYTSLGNGDPTG